MDVYFITFWTFLLCISNLDTDDCQTSHYQYSTHHFYGPYNLSRSNMWLLYYLESKTLQWMKFNNMTELSATILDLIYENNKDSVTQNNQPMENINKLIEKNT